MTKTLIVAGDATSAKAIERQHPAFGLAPHGSHREMFVTFPGQSVPCRRFDVILVTDYYSRVRYFAEGAEGERMDAWFHALGH